MDNSNNNSWPPDQNPTPPVSPPPYIPPSQNTPEDMFTPISPAGNNPIAYQPSPPVNNPWPSVPPQNPVPVQNSPVSTPPSPWTIPAQPGSNITPPPVQNVPNIQNPFTPPPAPVTPVAPSFSPPESNPWQQEQPSSAPLPDQYSDPNALAAGNFNSSALDNPYGAPLQPPPIDSEPQNSQPPVWSPPPVSPDTTALPTETFNINPSEQAPTDLSHLISNPDANTQTAAQPEQPETLVVPQVSTPEVPTIPTENRHGIPGWIIGLGVGLLIVVAGSSAYFILGIGQSPQNTSLPATEQPPVVQQAAPPPAAPEATPQATGSANFGELQEPATVPQASSAADILRSRQQGQ